MAAGGGRIPVSVFVDAGWSQVDTTNPEHVAQRRQLAGYVESNLLSQLIQSGYDARSVPSAAAYTASSPGRLLVVRIENYHAGSAAARMLVGMGAGAASLTTRVTYRERDRVLIDGPKSYGSSRDWRRIVEKINREIVTEMATRP
jgi:hypothetical protein